MLDVINLDFDYQDQPLLNKVAFHLPSGGLIHLRGRNGAGKTTLLKLIAGLYHPHQGEIQFLGRNIDQDRAEYQRNVCFVGHKTGINPNLTLKENCFFDLHYTSSCSRSTKKDELNNLKEFASIFKLEHHLDIPCGLLSAGQRRQAGLLRLWFSDVKLWLLDEPLVALDDTAITRILDKIAAHRKQGGAVLLTSHQQLPLKSSDYEEYCL
ncbi:heme ABC exporter ATP-binding protein CcmA [Fluoribacter gormanii]|uniref:Cytochrome c biogenesis ATP-binding export protein CcmA n=1 Tax=Fluoribacter gormanii TaxID=464 RepID=A0A377GKZ4_9GAMM|nr:heme ABC exporter ATP-binding protein CcmA [Fluoribacter gormanii]KTD02531.1 heme exporter protein CcmA [Fluoribacter gormanii]SIR44374.1 heme exporter protein A [Fluoribacter gormanii]STO25215.1 Cytochrome c biogenesis ATP-binding export protein CcmA [Fluoribacter gormanii]